jgi:hypothetical protein
MNIRARWRRSPTHVRHRPLASGNAELTLPTCLVGAGITFAADEREMAAMAVRDTTVTRPRPELGRPGTSGSLAGMLR